MFKNLAVCTTLAAGLSAFPAAAGPGVALALGAKASVDKAGRKCLLHAPFNNPHVTLLHFEGAMFEKDGKTHTETFHEIQRFLQNVMIFL